MPFMLVLRAGSPSYSALVYDCYNGRFFKALQGPVRRRPLTATAPELPMCGQQSKRHPQTTPPSLECCSRLVLSEESRGRTGMSAALQI